MIIPLAILRALRKKREQRAQPPPVVVNVDMSALAGVLERGVKVKNSVTPLPG